MFSANPRSDVHPAALCPVHENGLVDEEALATCIGESAQVDCVRDVANSGRTGEIMSLRPHKPARVAQMIFRALNDAISETGSQVQVISGVWAKSSLEAVDQTRALKRGEADAIPLVPPHR